MTDTQTNSGEGNSAKPARAKVCTKVYLDAEGNEHKSASSEMQVLRFKFADGTTRDVKPTQFQKSVLVCATFHGLSQTLGDVFAGVKGNVDEAIENFDTKLEVLMSGVWVKEREGVGPRPSMVADAIVAAKLAAGQLTEPVSPERYEEIRGKCSTAQQRKEALANRVIAAEYEKLKAAKAADKAAKAAEAAKGATLEGF